MIRIPDERVGDRRWQFGMALIWYLAQNAARHKADGQRLPCRNAVIKCCFGAAIF
jgi:hypothetical protein